MFIPASYVGTTLTTWNWNQRLFAYVHEVFQVLKEFFGTALIKLTESLVSLFFWLNEILPPPSEWVATAFHSTVSFVHDHIFFAHAFTWALFFGPIIILIPILLIHELFITVAYNMIYFLHGMRRCSLLDDYENLRLSLEDSRESLFSFVDRLSSTFNHWTSEHFPLMILRVSGGILGIALLYAIWSGW